MKRALGITVAVIFGALMIYVNIIGVYWIGAIFGFFMGAGIVLAAQREIVVQQAELQEENGVFRLHVTVRNKQKRPTAIWFVANVYYRGTSVGVANSGNIVLDGLGTGELVAVLSLPVADARIDEVGWKIIKWNYR